MDSEDGLVMTMKKADIDTSAPFRSVKEAVSLFGHKLLASQIYHPNKLQQNRGSEESYCSNRSTPPMNAELEETKQSLEKAKEESEIMASCLFSLQQELARTKSELEQLKNQDSEKQVLNIPGAGEAHKYIEIKVPTTDTMLPEARRYVAFTNPPSMARLAMAPQVGCDRLLERHPSLKKKKNKKPLIPHIIGGLFTKKKGRQEVA